jgi:hypothetical protein
VITRFVVWNPEQAGMLGLAQEVDIQLEAPSLDVRAGKTRPRFQ